MALKKVDELMAKEAELEAVRQKHSKAFEAYKATSIEDPAWTDRLNELNAIGRELTEKTEEAKEFLAKSKGFDSYQDMVNTQPLTPRHWL